MSSGYTVLASGRDALGRPWEVGALRTGLVIDLGPVPVHVADLNGNLATARVQLCLDGEQRERFAEAVARAVTPGQTPGQATVLAFRCCACCERDNRENGTVCSPPRHLSKCENGCDDRAEAHGAVSGGG